MDHLNNHGLIIRELRTRSSLSIQKAAGLIGKSVGWLCEVENDRGTSRLNTAEFDRIIEILGGSNQRHMFKTWIANQKNQDRTNKVFDGAVLKFIRIKKGISLFEASLKVGLSKGNLSKIENGAKPVTLEMRNQIMVAYGYSPSSFKNLSTDPIRSKAVPSRFKFQILLQKISKEQAERFFESFLAALQDGNPQT
ncbi:MAG: transcriptional regulator [Bdellovibrionaceae bacterium]|nr:transcriptional regulator [Pseudobdellovibrionaceae bacterium]